MKQEILTAKQESFIACINRGLNGTEAAKISYNISDNNVAAVIASQNLRKLKISSRIDIATNEYVVIDRLVKNLASALEAEKYVKREKQNVPDYRTRFKAIDVFLKIYGIKI